MPAPEIPTPPRLTGDAKLDAPIILDWAWQFYRATTQGDVPQTRLDTMGEIEDLAPTATLADVIGAVNNILTAARGPN